ncbi:uncharacterized protein [Argopecten irradians]|uniref:uncharacterized protein isoform X1 n=1 Tax=Argopecten irradians TaxID=31199 RepID=UPI00371CA47E
MFDIISISLFCGILANSLVSAEDCKASLGGSDTWHFYVYCEHGCCGTYYNQECCANYTGLIVGCVIAAVLFFGGIILVVCLCHHCNKKKTVGVVMAQPANNVNMVSNQVSYQQPGYQQPGPYQQPAPMGSPAYPPKY